MGEFLKIEDCEDLPLKYEESKDLTDLQKAPTPTIAYFKLQATALIQFNHWDCECLQRL